MATMPFQNGGYIPFKSNLTGKTSFGDPHFSSVKTPIVAHFDLAYFFFRRLSNIGV